ncbi:MAG: K(+)-transporting ATPase subunit C [Verrucomicrobiota bacterium]
MFKEIRGALLATIIFAVVCCGIYPLVVTGIARVVFKEKADGSLITDKDGTIRGSKLLGQVFTGDNYFHSRPSAAGANGYDAASSSGSNLGPTSQKLADQIKERVTAYRATNGLAENTEVPADAVTASGSGLDPHISLSNARIQAVRVAKVRNLAVDKVMELIASNTDKADLGLLGDAGVNVLQLNIALNALK